MWRENVIEMGNFMSESLFNPELYARTARQTAAEGIVMLRNENHVLPLKEGSKVALFGRTQFHYYKSGTGSGGMVNTNYVRGIREAIEQGGRAGGSVKCDGAYTPAYEMNREVEEAYDAWLVDHPFDQGAGWAKEPWYQEEMPISEELARSAAQQSDAAIIIIGRTAGEDKDNRAEEGSYYLTDTEREMLRVVCKFFDKTIVLLNVGNIIDMKWVEEYRPSSVLYVWQGGQEGGNGVLDILTGKLSPSGKLPDTIAYHIEDYPSYANFGDEKRNFYAEDIYVGYRYFETFARDKVMYPFGYGLSYTTFEVSSQGMDTFGEDGLKFRVDVKNTGTCRGKEVVQIYVSAPQGKLGKPARALCAFRKSRTIDPGDHQDMKITVPVTTLASYDDSGLTGYKSAWVLEAGSYKFYVGTDVRSAVFAGEMNISGTAVLEQLEEALAPTKKFQRMKPMTENSGEEIFEISYEDVPLRTVNPMERRETRLPAEIPYTGNKGYVLADVGSGKITMDTFIAQLSDEELAWLTRGEGMCSPKVTPGTASAFGGVTEELVEYGIPAACCADGPSGIRMDCGTKAFSLPSGTCIASTFNVMLVKDLYEWAGLEIRGNRVDLLLGPGMNIHRFPLNGRNFEYFSEDPVVTGKMAVAQLHGMREAGVSGVMKHFVANNQEFSRFHVESVISERALREIYLRGYEHVVKLGFARALMTTYGQVNGFWTSSNYDLLTTILRREWGFDGIVMTDWGACGGEEDSEGSVRSTACMHRAQNDLFMVTSDAKRNTNQDDTLEALQDGRLTRAELQRDASNICRYLLTSSAYLRLNGLDAMDEKLAKVREVGGLDFDQIKKIRIYKEYSISPEEIDTNRKKNTTFEVSARERGIFRLEMTIRAEAESPLSQIPMSIFRDKELLKSVTLMGSESEWRRVAFDLPSMFNQTFYLEFYFGESGMRIRDCKLVLVKSQEREIEEALAAR